MSLIRNVWRLRRRPTGEIADGDLEYLSEPLPNCRTGSGNFGKMLIEVAPDAKSL